jgi:hypothetical protein
VANRRLVARALAEAFVAGEWMPDAMADRGSRVLGHRPAWLGALALKIWKANPTPVDRGPRLRVAELAALISRGTGFRNAKNLRIVEPELAPGAPPPRPIELAALPLPALATPGALAELLGLSTGHLGWLAERRRERKRPEAFSHYRFHIIDKGRGRARVIEAPQPKLRRVQRRILRSILDAVPPHPSAHGFVRGRDATTFASAHAHTDVVIRVDLEDFFTSIPARRVHALFATLGYPEPVARHLTALVTLVTPGELLCRLPPVRESADLAARRRLLVALRERHLPQGAPTSPALSNLCALGLDRRLAGLADKIGARFTRYADDIAFSGGRDLARRATAVVRAIERIARDEGFRVNAGKVRIMKQSQRQELAGVVVNAGPAIARHTIDQLRAILTNCVRHGPETQNRAKVPDFRAHLRGRVAWVEHVSPQKGARLCEIFQRIRWPPDREGEPLAGC